MRMRWLDFDYQNAGGAPNRGGVFELANRDIETVLIDHATDVNNALMGLLRRGGPLVAKVRYVRWEEAQDAAAQAQAFLEEYQTAHGGRVPEGNAVPA